MRKILPILFGLLAVASVAQAQISGGLVAILLSGGPNLPGGQSFRYFADDISKLSTNIAGTTPVAADGDTVGMWRDASGNGYDLAAASDGGTRPLYHVRSGKGYVTGDGTDDLLYSATSPNLYGASGGNAFTVCVAYRWTSPVGSKTILGEADSASNNTVMDYFRSVGATPAGMLASMRGSDGATNIVTGTFITGINNGTDRVVCWVRNGATLTTYLEGVKQGTISVTTTNTVTKRINMFGRYRLTAADWAGVDVYGAVGWKSDQSTNMSKIQSVMARLHP